MQLGRTVDRPRFLVVHELDEGWVGDGGGCGVGISAIGGWIEVSAACKLFCGVCIFFYLAYY
jgi:hypothetical protein